jgi:hypothetical protein
VEEEMVESTSSGIDAATQTTVVKEEIPESIADVVMPDVPPSDDSTRRIVTQDNVSIKIEPTSGKITTMSSGAARSPKTRRPQLTSSGIRSNPGSRRKRAPSRYNGGI